MSRLNLTDSQTIARYLVQRFTDQQMVPEADLSALPAALAGATTQIVPFLFKPGIDPMATDEEIELVCEFVESPLRACSAGTPPGHPVRQALRRPQRSGPR